MKDGKFEPFDHVLVRNNEIEEWLPRLFSHYTLVPDYPYEMQDDMDYRYCIFYEGNEHLLGTTDKPEGHERFEFGAHVEARDNVHCDWVKGVYCRSNGNGTHEIFFEGIITPITKRQCRKADW